jgi:hypothetical protein
MVNSTLSKQWGLEREVAPVTRQLKNIPGALALLAKQMPRNRLGPAPLAGIALALAGGIGYNHLPQRKKVNSLPQQKKLPAN